MISIVIVEYNSFDEILDCQRYISDNIPQDILYEIIVSSNSVYPIKKQIELKETTGLKWVFNERNGGFAYAMNQGLKVANGDVLIIMNPDVLLGRGFKDMLNYLLRDRSIGIIAPKIINKNGMVQDSFREFITPINFISRHLKRIVKDEKLIVPMNAVEVDWVIGAFMMMPRNAYEAVQGLDDGYFLYCEDMDICKRMHLRGYSIIYYPNAVITYEGTRSARNSKKYARIFLQSLFRYWRKFGFK